MTTPQVAKLLNINRQEVYYLIRSGILSTTRLGGHGPDRRHYVIDTEDVRVIELVEALKSRPARGGRLRKPS